MAEGDAADAVSLRRDRRTVLVREAAAAATIVVTCRRVRLPNYGRGAQRVTLVSSSSLGCGSTADQAPALAASPSGYSSRTRNPFRGAGPRQVQSGPIALAACVGKYECPTTQSNTSYAAAIDPWSRALVTCYVRYVLKLDEIGAFKEYAQLWIRLINRLGGTHHGYFLPADDEKAKNHGRFSFPGLGSEGPPDVAVAVFSFPDWETYEFYRREAEKHHECKAATKIVEDTKCFISYERSFMMPVFE